MVSAVNRPWEIYTLSDPRSLRVRYVGVAVNAQRRFARHIWNAHHGTKTHCARWVRSLIAQGLTPVLAVIERGAGKSRVAAEQQWIALYRGAGRLTNLTDGGEGTLGYKASPTTRTKIAAALRGHALTAEHRAKLSTALTGRAFTAEHRAHISAAAQNMSPEWRAKMSVAHRRCKHSPETRAKMSAARRGKPWSAARRRAQKNTAENRKEAGDE